LRFSAEQFKVVLHDYELLTQNKPVSEPCVEPVRELPCADVVRASAEKPREITMNVRANERQKKPVLVRRKSNRFPRMFGQRRESHCSPRKHDYGEY
jgi:hypothetical protein